MRDVAKFLLAGLFARGLTIKSEDEQRQLELGMRDLLRWAHQGEKSSSGPQFPRGLCPIGVSRRTKGPRPPGWAGAPGTSAPRRVQAQPNRVELYREVFAFKSWKSHHCPSLASKKHNLVVGVGGSSGFTRWTHYLFFLSFRSIPLSKFCLRIQPSWWKSVQLSSASCDFSV